MTKSRGYDGGRLKRLLSAWSLGSAVVIVMPLVILFVGWIVHKIKCRDGGDGGQWCEQGDNQRDGDFWNNGWAVLIFAFVWSYVLFIWLAGYGHAVLSHLHGVAESRGDGGTRWKRYMCSKKDQTGPYNMGLLTGATILFGNLSFLLGMILAIPLGSGREHMFRRASIIPLAFLLWALFCLIFSCWLLQFQPLSSSADQDADAVTNSEYHRVGDGAANRGISSAGNNKKSSSRGRSPVRTGASQSRSVSRQQSKPDDTGRKKGLFSGFRSKSRDRGKSSSGWNTDTSMIL